MKYPFSPQLLDALPEELAELFRELENTLLVEICSRLNVSGQLNEVTLQDIKALRAHGIDLKDIKKAIQKATGTGVDELNKVLDDTVQRNQQYYSEAIDLAGLTQPDTLVEAADIAAIIEQCHREYGNITRSMGFLVDSGRTMLEPAKAYQWALDSATMQVQSGAVSYEQAIKSAAQQLADSGLKTVDYESGHVDSVDVAVRRAVMTGVNQLNRKYTEQSMDYLETDLVEVSAHYGARNVDGPNGWENHERWQGKWYRWKVYARRYPNASEKDYPDFERVCGYGDVTGILGANCRHSYNPVIEGANEPTYTQSDLDRMKAENNVVTYDGKTYDGYQATQMQRRLERTIRKQKRLVNSYKAAGVKEDAQTANIKLRRLETKYTEFSRAANLPEYTERKNVLYQTEKTAQNQARSSARELNDGARNAIISTRIENPINARDGTVGKPNAVSIFGSRLSKRQENLLSTLGSDNSRVIVSKRDVKMKDLAALTAKTGDEFAMFTKGGERLIVRGNSVRVNITAEMAKSLAANGYRWSGHTHPGLDELTTMASYGDVEILKAFGQMQSAIYDSLGRHQIFRR